MRRIVPRAGLGLGLSLLLFACGQNSGPTTSNSEEDGTAYPWSYTAPVGKVTALSLTPGENNLYFEPILAARNGYGPIEIDHSNGGKAAGDGKTITLNGTTYARGFGTHANSELRYSLKGTNGAQCTRFTATVGVDDEVGYRGSVVFQVFLDGSKAYDSGVMTGVTSARKIDLNVSGKQELRMVVTDAGDGSNYDHADWAVPKVFCQSNTTHPSGSLDTSFDGDGKIQLTGLAKFVKVLQQPDGKLLAVTEDRANTGQVRRYLLSGQLDATFGQQGAVALPSVFVARNAAFAPDSKLFIYGISNTSFAFFISRHQSDGQLDPSFGNAGILSLSSNFGEPYFVVQPDGKIIVLTFDAKLPNDPRDPDPGIVRSFLTRYTASGTIDPSFGQAGHVVITTTPEEAPFTTDSQGALVLQRDGKLVITYGGRSPVLARYLADGRPDTSFGEAGVARVRYATNEADARVESLTEQPDSKLVVAGYTQDSIGLASVALARYTPEGRLDSSFGDGGVVRLSPNLISDNPVELTAQADGRLLVALEHTGVARLTAAGRLDTTFAEGGIFRTRIANQYTRGVTLQADGKILLNVYRIEPAEDGYLLRLLP